MPARVSSQAFIYARRAPAEASSTWGGVCHNGFLSWLTKSKRKRLSVDTRLCHTISGVPSTSTMLMGALCISVMLGLWPM